MVTWPDHLTRHSTSSEQFKQSQNFNSPQITTTLRPMRPTLNIRCQTHACDLDLYPMLFCQLFGFSPTSPRATRFGLPIFIFYLLGGSAGGVIFAPPESHWISSNNAGGCILALFGLVKPPWNVVRCSA